MTQPIQNNNLFEQLSKTQPPPAPSDFGQQVHQRLNSRLLVVHLADFVTRCLPYAMFHFSLALIGLILFTLTGRFPKKGETHAIRPDQNRGRSR